MIRPLLKLVRFPLVLTAVADSATGYLYIVLASGGEIFPRTLAWLAASSACLYMAGIALNDVADVKRDRELHPERPIPSGKLGLMAAALAGVLLLGGGVALAMMVGRTVVMMAGLVSVGILAYNLVLKEYGIPGALMMGMIRGCNLAMGLVAAWSVPDERWFEVPSAISAPYGLALALVLYIFVTTLISLQEESKSPARPFRILWIIQMLVVASTIGMIFPPHYAGIGAVAAMTAALFFSGRDVTDSKGVMGHIRLSILLVIALDASFLLSAGRLEWGLLMLGLLVPSWLMMKVYRHL